MKSPKFLRVLPAPSSSGNCSPVLKVDCRGVVCDKCPLRNDSTEKELLDWLQEQFSSINCKVLSIPLPEFKKGDRVLVRDNVNEKWVKRYFSHYALTDDLLQYRCFIDGKDEWASNGRIMGWKDCKKWEE